MNSRFLLTTSEYSEEEGINPKILGYIFEQGLDKNALGAFYTPKNVTSRMARSALTNWLWQNMSESQKQSLEAELNFKFHEFPQAVCAEQHVCCREGYPFQLCSLWECRRQPRKRGPHFHQTAGER